MTRLAAILKGVSQPKSWLPIGYCNCVSRLNLFTVISIVFDSGLRGNTPTYSTIGFPWTGDPKSDKWVGI